MVYTLTLLISFDDVCYINYKQLITCTMIKSFNLVYNCNLYCNLYLNIQNFLKIENLFK